MALTWGGASVDWICFSTISHRSLIRLSSEGFGGQDNTSTMLLCSSYNSWIHFALWQGSLSCQVQSELSGNIIYMEYPYINARVMEARPLGMRSWFSVWHKMLFAGSNGDLGKGVVFLLWQKTRLDLVCESWVPSSLPLSILVPHVLKVRDAHGIRYAPSIPYSRHSCARCYICW